MRPLLVQTILLECVQGMSLALEERPFLVHILHIMKNSSTYIIGMFVRVP